MRLKLIAVGQKMPGWVTEGFHEYSRRLPPEMPLELIEIPLAKRGRNPDIARLVEREGEQMLQAIGDSDWVVALDIPGKSWTTEALAGQLERWQMQGQNLALLVGGPDGLAPGCRARASQSWSLSPLTLPHPLVRVLVAEQLYRAWTITRNHPYHR